jgi:hypothetical protein
MTHTRIFACVLTSECMCYSCDIRVKLMTLECVHVLFMCYSCIIDVLKERSITLRPKRWLFVSENSTRSLTVCQFMCELFVLYKPSDFSYMNLSRQLVNGK